MMNNNLPLIIHNVFIVTSITVSLTLIIFLFKNNWKKDINKLLILTSFSVIIFEISHLIGTNISDHHTSKIFFMGNISVIFICLFNFHCVMTVLHRNKNNTKIIISLYILGILLSIFYIIYPDQFMLDSVPKLYFPNYYVPGPLHWLARIIFNMIIPLMFIIELIKSYTKTKNIKEKKRIKYFTISIISAWFFGSLTTPLAYNIPIDPMYGIYFPILFCIPFTYAVFNYDLLDIRIVAKRAFYYGILVAICAGMLIFFNFLNRWVDEIIPGIPIYVVPLISAIFAIGIGIAVWKKVRESDILKFELVNKTMHEIRTPLTHIKLASESLGDTMLNEKQLASLDHIKKANDKMVRLTEEWMKKK